MEGTRLEGMEQGHLAEMYVQKLKGVDVMQPDLSSYISALKRTTISYKTANS